MFTISNLALLLLLLFVLVKHTVTVWEVVEVVLYALEGVVSAPLPHRLAPQAETNKKLICIKTQTNDKYFSCIQGTY